MIPLPWLIQCKVGHVRQVTVIVIIDDDYIDLATEFDLAMM